MSNPVCEPRVDVESVAVTVPVLLYVTVMWVVRSTVEVEFASILRELVGRTLELAPLEEEMALLLRVDEDPITADEEGRSVV